MKIINFITFGETKIHNFPLTNNTIDDANEFCGKSGNADKTWKICWTFLY